MKKQIIKRLTALLLAVVCTATFYTMAYAAVVVYSNIETEHIASLADQTFNEVEYTAVGGIATGKYRTSMFVLKSEKKTTSYTEQKAVFFDYPNIESNTTDPHIYLLPYAGHANAMTIDDNNIYICGWTKIENNVGNQKNNTYNNWIIKIPRNLFSSFRKLDNGDTLPKDNKNTTAVEGYSILYPQVKVIDANGAVTYEKYKNVINAITLHNDNGEFIINYPLKGRGYDKAFTTAKLETDSAGSTYFVVSEDPEDIFVVENNVQYQNATDQDICYSPGHGLFVPKWYGKKYKEDGTTVSEYYNETKNVIMWADIDGDFEYKNIKGVNYRYYTPDKINVNKTSEKNNSGQQIYNKFEVESIAFTVDGDMLFSSNIDSINGTVDSVFKLTHDNGQKFLLS